MAILNQVPASNGSSFQAEKAAIIQYNSCTDISYSTKASCEAAAPTPQGWSPAKAIYYNVALTTNSTGVYTIGNPVTSAAGTGINAAGIVADIETSANDILYVKYLTKTATSPNTAASFYEGDTLNLGQVVTRVEANSLKLGVADSTSFDKGSDIVSNANMSAYTYAVALNLLSVNETSKASGATSFKTLQRIYNHETSALSTANQLITSVTHDNFIIFERGKLMSQKLGIEAGNGIVYSISPILPTGLALNTTTGEISGTATSISARQNYTITATNFIGAATYVFSMEVKDYFEIKENSGASSFIFHKVGDFQNSRKCRIDASDILSMTNAKALDIRCFLDGEEQDVNLSDLVFNELTGAGVCQYVQYAPYYFNSFSPIQSYQVSSLYKEESVLRSGCTSVLDSGPIPTAEMCDGNYKSIDNKYPNCDEGTLGYWVETYDNTCALTNRIYKTIDCGGAKSACIAGPITDTFSDAAIKSGARSEIITSNIGLSKTYTHVSPMAKGDFNINIRHANGTISNQCTSGAADSLTWKNATNSANKLGTPMGSASNPYYTFSCLNAAYETKARIRVIVREWDQTFKINNDIYNQSFAAPASQMNNAGIDPIFGQPYNNILDWDNANLNGLAPTYTGGACGVHGAGSCSNITDTFATTAQCTAAGGTQVTPPSCSGAFPNKVTCEKGGSVWTKSSCTFSTQYQCKLYGGTWAGDEEYKFPEQYLGF
jgi:hypothetical protein